MFPLALLNAASPPVYPASLTLALLHFDGVDGTQIFTDSSQYGNNLFSANSNTGVYLSNTWSKFGATSCYFDGASFVNYIDNYLQPSFGQLGSSDFTIECWIKPASIATQEGLFNIYGDSSITPVNCKIVGGVLTVGVQIVDGQTWIQATHQTSIMANSEYHVVMQRRGNLLQVFLNGVKGTTDADIGTGSLTFNGTGVIQVGAGWNYVGGFTQQFTGYIDEFRMRKEAMYLADFTPPTAPFTG